MKRKANGVEDQPLASAVRLTDYQLFCSRSCLQLPGYYHSSAISRPPELHFGPVRSFLKQLGDGPVNDRVLEARAKLRQRYDYEPAAMQLRMRQSKTLVIDHLIAIEK